MSGEITWIERWKDHETKEIELKYQNRRLTAEFHFFCWDRLINGFDIKYYENDKLVLGASSNGLSVTFQLPLTEYTVTPKGRTPILASFSKKYRGTLYDVLTQEKIGYVVTEDLIHKLLMFIRDRVSDEEKQIIEKLDDIIDHLAVDVAFEDLASSTTQQ